MANYGERRRRAIRLIVDGLPTAKIAKLLGVSPRTIRKDIAKAMSDRVLTVSDRRQPGVRPQYERGPRFQEIVDITLRQLPTDRVGPGGGPGGGPTSPAPVETQVPGVRHHDLRFKVPIFDDELVYKVRDPTSPDFGTPKPWTVAQWSGDYREIGTPGVRRFYFQEGRFGAWELYYLSQPKAIGRGARKRMQRATAVLYAAPIEGPADAVIDYAKERAFAAAMDLLLEISRNRGLRIGAIPEPIRPGEFAFPVQDSTVEPLPKGRVQIASEPAIWKDESPPGKGPEVETSDVSAAGGIALTLTLAKLIPGFPERWAAMERDIAEIRTMLRDISGRR